MKIVKSLLLATALVASAAQALDMDQVKAAVGAQLKDPWSAHYRNVRVSGKLICGQVNAKNSMGGYTGFVPFYIKGSKVLIGSADPDDISAGLLVVMACARGDEAKPDPEFDKKMAECDKVLTESGHTAEEIVACE